MILLVRSSLYFYPISSQRDIYNRKTQLFQERTQWCQQIIAQEHIFGEFALVHLTFGSCTYPTDTFPFTYQSFKGPGMCAVENFQGFIFGNSRSPNKFIGKPKIVSLTTSSQEILKHKSMLTFTFILRTIYEVNDTAQYIERFSPATNNDAILAALLQHEEDFFRKWG